MSIPVTAIHPPERSSGGISTIDDSMTSSESAGLRGLPREYLDHYHLHRETILRRLDEFRRVPPEEYVMELCFCILTPQSRALHAELVMAELRERGFPEKEFDPTPHLRDPAHYIRFHNQKGERLRRIAADRERIGAILASDIPSAEQREWLTANVKGLGWKESSHLLRNIGHLDLAIIDRHILKHMVRCGVLEAVPKSIGTRKIYLDLERRFMELAASCGMHPQELDLLFWSLEEGSVRK